MNKLKLLIATGVCVAAFGPGQAVAADPGDLTLASCANADGSNGCENIGTKQGEGPLAIAVHPTLDVIYTANSADNKVVAYQTGSSSSPKLSALNCLQYDSSATSSSTADGCTNNKNLSDVSALQVTADAKYLITLSATDRSVGAAVTVWSLNPTTGAIRTGLGMISCVSSDGNDGCVADDLMSFPQDMVMAGSNVYVSSKKDNSVIAMFLKTNGTLEVLDKSSSTSSSFACVSGKTNSRCETYKTASSSLTDDGLTGPVGLAANSDGGFLYSVSPDSGSITRMKINSGNGLPIAYNPALGVTTGCLTSQLGGTAGAAGVASLDECSSTTEYGDVTLGGRKILVSKNSDKLYLTGSSSSGVIAFDRDQTTGDLTQDNAACVAEAAIGLCADSDALNNVLALAEDPNGVGVYVGTGLSNDYAISRYSLNDDEDTLNRSYCIKGSGSTVTNSCDTTEYLGSSSAALEQISDIKFSGDGETGYAVSYSNDTVLMFQRESLDIDGDGTFEGEPEDPNGDDFDSDGDIDADDKDAYNGGDIDRDGDVDADDDLTGDGEIDKEDYEAWLDKDIDGDGVVEEDPSDPDGDDFDGDGDIDQDDKDAYNGGDIDGDGDVDADDDLNGDGDIDKEDYTEFNKPKANTGGNNSGGGSNGPGTVVGPPVVSPDVCSTAFYAVTTRPTSSARKIASGVDGQLIASRAYVLNTGKGLSVRLNLTGSTKKRKVIKQVTFTLGGKKVLVDKRAPYKVTLPTGLKGTQKLSAKVAFKKGKKTKTVILKTTYLDCTPLSFKGTLKGSAKALKLSFSGNVGSGNLNAASSTTFKLAAGIRLQATKKLAKRKIGSIKLTGSGGKTLSLKYPKKVKGKSLTVATSGTIKVVAKTGNAGSLTVTGIPQGITGITVKLSGAKGVLKVKKTCIKKPFTLSFKDTVRGSKSIKSYAQTSSKRCK